MESETLTPVAVGEPIGSEANPAANLSPNAAGGTVKTSMTYSEKLKDPRWQKKRLEIFQRDGFACVHCHCDDVTLHVHHRYYVSGRMPWEYPNQTLQTVCEECHDALKEIFQADSSHYEGWEIVLCHVLSAKRPDALEFAYSLQKQSEALHEPKRRIIEAIAWVLMNDDKLAANVLKRGLKELKS